MKYLSLSTLKKQLNMLYCNKIDKRKHARRLIRQCQISSIFLIQSELRRHAFC